LKGRQGSPEDISLIIVYTLAKALGISPLEVYQMPSKLVLDLLSVHRAMAEIEKEELDKLQKQNSSGKVR
tara:strand:- start:5041 stop:5250 length:210 start_codon:yes stop_codon:yes gene_type:complete